MSDKLFQLIYNDVFKSYSSKTIYIKGIDNNVIHYEVLRIINDNNIYINKYSTNRNNPDRYRTYMLFVELLTTEDANKCIKILNKYKLKDSILHCTHAKRGIRYGTVI